MVPDGWTCALLGDLMDFRNGINADKEQYGSGVKFVNVMDVLSNDAITESNIMGRLQVSDKQLTENRLKHGDVLFNRTSETFQEIAMCAVFVGDSTAVFGGFVIRGRPSSENISARFSMQAFQATFFRSQVIRLGQGAVRANIGQKDLAKVKFLLPPLPEQQKIAKILQTWDRAIATTEKLIEASKQQKKALMQQLLTGKKRFSGESSSHCSCDTTNTTHAQWESKKLGTVAELQRGFDLPSSKRTHGEVPIISSGGLSGYHSEAKVKAPGVVTGRYGSIGEVFFLERNFWPLNTALWVKDFHSNDPKFIYYLLMNFDFKKFSDKTGVPGINRNDLHTVKVSVPPLPEQLKIAQALSSADKQINLLRKKLVLIRSEKKALMQQLLTGKRRVKVDD